MIQFVIMTTIKEKFKNREDKQLCIMKKFILGLLLFLLSSVCGMAKFHHFHHYHHSSHHNYVTTPTKRVQPHNKHPKIKRQTSISNTFWRNGILYYIILNPKRGHVYDNKLVLCEGCHKVLVKRGVRYCSKCRRLKK